MYANFHIYTFFCSFWNVAGREIIGFRCSNYLYFSIVMLDRVIAIHYVYSNIYKDSNRSWFMYVSDGLGKMECLGNQILITESPNSSLWSKIIKSAQLPRCGSQRIIIFVWITLNPLHTSLVMYLKIYKAFPLLFFCVTNDEVINKPHCLEAHICLLVAHSIRSSYFSYLSPVMIFCVWSSKK